VGAHSSASRTGGRGERVGRISEGTIHRSAWKARILRSPLVPQIFAPSFPAGEKNRSASHNGPDIRRSDVAKERTPWPSSSTRR
jgi:hypothetical protein